MEVSNWRTLIIFDVLCEENKKVFYCREYTFSENINMGMNDPCFCGSGKKIKKCHPDIHEKSVIANLYKVFNFIDSEYTIANNPYCCKGCNSCCSDYFSISLVEFFMILQHLEIISPQEVGRYSEKAKQIAAEFDVNQTDFVNIDGFPSCIFINDRDGSCKIYEVRPTLCRLYGNTELTRCPKILNDRHMMQILLKITDERLEKNIDSFEYNGNNLRPIAHPIVYWFSKLDSEGRLENQKIMKLYQAAKNRPISDFVKLMLL